MMSVNKLVLGRPPMTGFTTFPLFPSGKDAPLARSDSRD